MGRDKDQEDTYYDDEEVIGSYRMYHRPSCHVIANIKARNYKKFRSWKNAEALGLEPCGICGPFHLPPTTYQSGPKEVQVPRGKGRVEVKQLAEWRREIAQLLNKLDGASERPFTEGLAARISRLSRGGVIPREVAACMKTITEMRNAAEYEGKNLSSSESAAVEASWAVIKEWAQTGSVSFPEHNLNG